MQHVWETGNVHIAFWWEQLREEEHLQDPSVNRRIILKWILKKWDGGAWTDFTWLRTGAGVNALINLRVPQKAGN
jgi:hypothetical protein